MRSLYFYVLHFFIFLSYVCVWSLNISPMRFNKNNVSGNETTFRRSIGASLCVDACICVRVCVYHTKQQVHVYNLHKYVYVIYYYA